jgi:hypothetical protein
MDRSFLPGLALVAGLALAGCSEPPQESSLQGPSTLANVITEPCTPTVFNALINGYFASPEQNQVKAQRDSMLTELNKNTAAGLAQARVHGFNILRAIALRSKVTSPPSASTGSELAVEVLQCTFFLTGETTAVFFTEELDRAAGGTFEVRGGAGDPTTPVQAAVNNVVIAGMAPPKDVTWDNSLNGKRVLFYGDPASSSPSDYNFSELPQGLTYDPALVVTTCVLDNDPTLMVTETGAGALAFVGDLDHIGCAGPLATGPTGRFDLLRHLAALGRDLLLPEPASASMALLALVGGSKRGQSTFDIKQVSLDVTVSTTPTNVGPLVVNTDVFSLTVTVADNGTPVNGTVLTLAIETNVGTTNSVKFKTPNGCDGVIPPRVTGVDFTTTTTYSNLCITKTGGVKVVALADVVGREVAGLAKTAKIKVIPR